MDKSDKIASRSRIFISYRRQDAAYAADRLAEELRKHFPRDRVFQDMASIDPGVDFEEALERGLNDCAAALVIIGAGWLTASNRKGQRRLDLADDWVRHEVEESLRRPEVRVFPVLLDTEMPSAEELPEPLRPLARRQAFPLTVRHWTNDVDTLIEFLKKVPSLAATVVSEAKTMRSPSVHEKPEETIVDTLSIKAQSVPTDFQKDVERAHAGGYSGDLRLLAEEAQGFEWGVEGVRLAGEALFENHAFAAAREAFERLRETLPDDVPANLRLSAIYQALGDPTPSEEAIHRALPHATSPKQRAEAFSLLGSSAKARWLDDWGDAEVDARSHAALGSGYLSDSLGWYLKASNEDAGDYYAGANALALLKIQGGLALKARDVWQENFDDPDKATIALSEGEARAKQIQESLRRSLGMDGGGEQDPGNPVKAIARAEFLFLTTDKPRQVEHEYRKAVALARNDPFILSAARKNIEPFEMLRLKTDNITAAFGVIDNVLAAAGRIQPPERILLFKGYMIDDPERKEPRFPPTKAAEEKVRSMLREAITAEQALSDGKIVGVCSGACGGDILFHEVCAELGIATRLYLALPRELFCVTSVQHAGPDWVERYYMLNERLAPRILAESKDLPSWLRERQDYGIWQRADKWMLYNALAIHGKHLTLITLWDTGDDDGPRGIDQLLFEVSARGYKMVRLPAELLKTLA
jgi:tetratricopeptide (TPR) repeat protein